MKKIFIIIVGMSLLITTQTQAADYGLASIFTINLVSSPSTNLGQRIERYITDLYNANFDIVPFFQVGGFN